jgi:uncharacterized protein YbjQ (UPF0145 family)
LRIESRRPAARINERPYEKIRRLANECEWTSIAGKERPMLIVTTETIAGRRVVETKGEVFGVVVRSRGLGGNITAGLRSLVGGEIKEYTQLLEEARQHAIDRMVQHATERGADAIIMMRFDSSEIGNTMSEIVAYGTAVVTEPAG